jgi:hypothetical protein
MEALQASALPLGHATLSKTPEIMLKYWNTVNRNVHLKESVLKVEFSFLLFRENES